MKLAELDYIQQMLLELCRISRRRDLGFLTYLIEMAYSEASDMKEGMRPLNPKPAQPRDPLRPASSPANGAQKL
ncbi:hypothetical protein [Limoniibacter endophyticus]|nr:hypothetical protein [Limoniibacter endophyticus]